MFQVGLVQLKSEKKARSFISSDAPEPTFWRAEPSFSNFRNEPKITLNLRA